MTPLPVFLLATRASSKLPKPCRSRKAAKAAEPLAFAAPPASPSRRRLLCFWLPVSPIRGAHSTARSALGGAKRWWSAARWDRGKPQRIQRSQKPRLLLRTTHPGRVQQLARAIGTADSVSRAALGATCGCGCGCGVHVQRQRRGP